MTTIIIGVTASIAAYKVLELIKKLKTKFGIEIILTKNTERLINKKEFEKLLGKKVHSELFHKGWDYKDYLRRERSEHISLADKADLFLICPATANIIGKIANGVADDLLTTSIMATNAPVVLCPAMNCKMWQNPIVQGNVSKLRKVGYYFVEPEKGKLACGYSGVGRLASIDKIISSIKEFLNKKELLKNKKIIVTAGATIEEIDPIRIITNKSSGKMGIYIAEEASKMGADVTLIRGRTDIEPSARLNDVRIESVNDMLRELRRYCKQSDVIIHAAAVSDFSIDKKFSRKIKSEKDKLVLRLRKNKKIIDEIKKINKRVTLIGFKAEFKVSEKQLVNRAYSMLKRTKADFVVANDVSKGTFGSEFNSVVIVDKNKKTKKIEGSKKKIASMILKHLFC